MKKIIIWVLIVVAIIGGTVVLVKKSKAPGKYDQFAQCLKDKGLKFYGAFWCPHCQKQKAEFGVSAKLLPYIECSNADSSQNKACTDAEVEGYPTWEYPTAFSIKSATAPVVCNPAPNNTKDPETCKQVSVTHHKEWIFVNTNIPPIQTKEDPTIKDGVYTFAPGTRSVGETPMQFLADQSNCAYTK